MEEQNQRQSIVSGEENRQQQKELERAEEEEEQLQQQHQPLRLQSGAEEKLVLQFLDSMDNYLTLIDALSSTLREGWLDLASARHSMGVSRINSSLLDLKFHSASASLNITQSDVEAVSLDKLTVESDSLGMQPCFEIHKRVSSEQGNSGLVDDNDTRPQKSTTRLQSSETSEMTAVKNKTGLTDDGQIQKDRTRCLSVFGVFVSPKLRATQLSFEKALRTLVELANIRSSLLYSFQQIHKEAEDNNE